MKKSKNKYVLLAKSKYPFGGMINQGVTGISKILGANDNTANLIGSGVATASGLIPGFQDNLLQGADLIGDIGTATKDKNLQNIGNISKPIAGLASNFMANGGFVSKKVVVNNSKGKPFTYQTLPMMGEGGMSSYKLEDGGIANAEVENNEVMRDTQGNTEQFYGATHENGGIPANLEPGTQIYSDRLKSSTGKTFAEEAKKYDTSKHKKVLEDNKADSLRRKTAQLMFDKNNKELTKLFNEQESQKTNNFSTDMFAFGGVLTYKNGGIHIKDSHKGLFTKSAKNAGMGVQEYANKILAHKENYSSTLVKRANFAHNASKWKHAEGGTIDANRIPTYFENGGTKQAFLDRAMDAQIKVGYFDNGGFAFAPNGPLVPKQENNMFDSAGTNYVGLAPNYNDQFAQNQANVNQENINSGYNNTQPNNTNNQPDWSKIGTEVGIGAISNMGNLAYLADQGKRYDNQKFYGYNPQTLDPTNALRDVNESTFSARRAIPGMTSGSGSLAINSLLANKLQGDMTKADVRQRYDEANAGITNQGQQINNSNRYRTDDINAANKGQALTNYYQALGMTGRNVGQQARDNQTYGRQENMDKMRMKTLDDLYSNFQFDKISGHWIPKK